MKKILGVAAGALVAAIAVPGLAQAQSAYTTTYVNLRAGPGFDYPIVTAVPAEVALQQYGCLNDWSWCDVSYGPYRGWMAGDYIAYVNDNRWVPLYEYGPRYRVPIVTFNFGTYWDRWYRGRPFYHDRDRWSRYDHDHHDEHRPPPHRAMPAHMPRGYVQHNNDHRDDNRGGPDRNDHGNDHGNDRGNDHGNDHGNDRGGHDNNWQQDHH